MLFWVHLGQLFRASGIFFLEFCPKNVYIALNEHRGAKMSLIQATENNTLEYKRELPGKDRKWLKTVVAFANGKGGQIVFGIDDETHSVVGVASDEIARTIDHLTDAIMQNCTPQIVPDVRVETHGGKYVIVVEIDSGQNTPYYLSREGIEAGTYIRAAATTRPADPHVRLELILRSKGKSYDEYILPHEAPASTEEIDNLCRDIAAYHTQHKEVTIEHLESWRLLKEEGGRLLPSVGFCLLARPKSIHFSGIQCAVFLGEDRVKFLDNKEFRGPLYRMIEQAEEYVLRNTRTEYVINGVVREEVYELPRPALREIIVNAVLHRNYLSPAFIQIAIHPDRIDFFSPGGLYGSMTRERMLQGNCSSLRNPLLADVFHRMNIVERWGSGISRIFDACRTHGLPAPEYSVDDMGVTVTIRRTPLAQRLPERVQRKSKSAHAEQQKNETTRKSSANSSERLLLYIRQHPDCTFSQMLKSFDIPRRTLSYRLEKLRETGLIYRTGSTRNSVWNAVK